jgi:hypothetical protein
MGKLTGGGLGKPLGKGEGILDGNKRPPTLSSFGEEKEKKLKTESAPD